MHARGSFDLHTSLMNKDRYGNEIMKLKDFEEGTHLGIVGFWLKFSIAMLLSEDSVCQRPLPYGFCRLVQIHHSCV